MALELQRNDAIQQNGQQQTAIARRSPLAEWLGFDPFDIFRNFVTAMPSLDFGIDVTSTEDGYIVEVPVPGYKPEEIEVAYKDGYITVSGKADRRSLNRSLMLPEEVDPESITARVEHGLLTLTLKRHPSAQPKKIPVQH
jgi:HSP20 family molecular chaperone IbpA